MTLLSRTAARRGAAESRAAEPVLTVPEVLVGTAVVGLAVFAWMALLLLDNHVGRLSLVALAAAGCFLTVLAISVFGAARPRLRLDPWTLLVLAVVGIVAGVFFFPGFPYGITDKDPGNYVAIGAAFATHHSYSWPDVLAQHVHGIVDQSPGARWPAVWVKSGTTTIVPQFYHLWPALLAMAYDIGGVTLEVQVAPLVALVGVLAFVLLLRRAVPGPASLPVAATGGLLLATNMLEVWQAKYPSTEVFAQMLFVTVLLGVVVALRTGWRPAAGIAGLLLGIGWLERPDTLLVVGVAVGVGAALVALRRWDARCTWFAVGFAVTLPHVLWQAYGAARVYTLGNGVPRLSTVAGATIAAFALAFVIRLIRPLSDGIAVRLTRARWQQALGLIVCALAFGLLVLGFERGRFFGANYQHLGATLVRTFNDQNLRRLSWFVTIPGIALAGLGIAVVALRRWQASLWALVLPALLIAPVYIENSRVAARLMWWGRRYVPEVLPSVLALIALTLGVAAFWRIGRRRGLLAIPAAALAVFLLVVFVGQSRPLRHHHEYAGSFAVTAKTAAAAGGRTGVFLFSFDGCCTTPEYLFGGALWLERGQYDALLPETPAAVAPYVRAVAAGMPGHPVFVIAQGVGYPAGLSSVPLVPAEHVTASLPMWEESLTHRPAGEQPPVPVDFTVWRVAGT